MSKIIKLNGDGQLVAEDPDTGEELPVSFEALEAESVSTDVANITENLAVDLSVNNPHPTRSMGRTGPLSVKPYPDLEQPVIRGDDIDARFVADPFWISVGSEVYMFVEVFNDDETKDTGLFTSYAGNLSNWEYQGVVISEAEYGAGMSYPWVRKIGGTWYMIASTAEQETPIWTTDDQNFPMDWTLAEKVDTPGTGGDPTPIYLPWQNRWYIIAEDGIIYADQGRDLTGRTWSAHSGNQVREYPRPGGRPTVYEEGYIDIWYQDGDANYGDKIRGYRITELTPDSYEHEQLTTSPIIEGTDESGDWNELGMHHIDPSLAGIGGLDMVLVDGHDQDEDGSNWSIGIYATGEAVSGAENITLSGPEIRAWEYDGASPDARLDNALSDANNGETVYLEAEDYVENRTISKDLKLIGTGLMFEQSTNINANWTLAASSSFLKSVFVSGGADITIDADNVIVSEVNNANITFNSGTDGGLVDTSINTTVTDNGTNNIGDV